MQQTQPLRFCIAILYFAGVVAAALGEEDSPQAPENFLQASPRVFVGGEPHDEAMFAFLAKSGIQAIVSVDGARPNLEAAAKHGLRYIHIPIGYDGVPPEAAAALARLARDVPGPIFIHCHHGKHRGPAAAAVACLAMNELSKAEARVLLERAGTSPNYRGLWRDVDAWRPPSADAVLPELVAEAKVDSLAAAMSKIDRSFDRLKLIAAAGWRPPADHPDLAPRQEALLLREQLRESSRHLSGDYDERFKAWMVEAERGAQALELELAKPAARAHCKTLETSCKRCHEAYRD